MHLIISILLVYLTSLFGGKGNVSASECDIREFYSRVDLDAGTKVLDAYNNVEEGEAVLVPTRLDLGIYEVEVKRLTRNYYAIVGTDLVVETSYCSEYASYREPAILRVESNYGFTKGSLVF